MIEFLQNGWIFSPYSILSRIPSNGYRWFLNAYLCCDCIFALDCIASLVYFTKFFENVYENLLENYHFSEILVKFQPIV